MQLRHRTSLGERMSKINAVDGASMSGRGNGDDELGRIAEQVSGGLDGGELELLMRRTSAVAGRRAALSVAIDAYHERLEGLWREGRLPEPDCIGEDGAPAFAVEDPER